MNPTCPECGARLEIDPACVISEQVLRYMSPGHIDRDAPYRRVERVAPAALCSRCEFCIEIK